MQNSKFGMFESVEELVEWIEDDVDRIGKIEDSPLIEQEVFPTEAILASGEDRMEKKSKNDGY